MNLTAADIRPAVREEHAAVTRAVVAAFRSLPVCHWLVPHVGQRDQILGGYFGLLLDHLLTHGVVQVIDTATARGGALHAVAGWLPADVPHTAPGHHARVTAVTGPFAPRFHALEDDLATTGTQAPGHHHLTVLAVAPRAHNRGAGSLLLAHHLNTLDQLGQPASLEAASPRSVSLYQRHGFRRWGPVIATAPRPEQAMTPMRRPAQQQPADRPGATGRLPVADPSARTGR